MSEVAALAGVSTGTASKALNGRGAMRPETRLRVQHAADQLGFVVNAAARSLQTGRTYTVGMITTDTIGRFSIPLLIGAEDALGAGQMSVFLCDARDDPIREQYYLRTLLGRKVDGIIVTGRRTQARAPIGADLPVPVVYAFISSTDPRDCSVVPDEADGARRAIRHLLATGAPIDAVFCGSDQIARGLAEALREAGHDIPGDVALVGFDNWDVMVDACRPALTSIDMDLEGIGRTAAELLLSAINGNPVHGRRTHPCRLVPRDSTAVVPLSRSDRAR